MFQRGYLLQELRRRWGRTLVTALGLAVGVGLVLGIIGLSQGLSEAQTAVLQPLSSIGRSTPTSASLMVGPEGGWSGSEIEAATRAGYVPVTLGRRTLRADAVPIIAIGVLQFLWNDL